MALDPKTHTVYLALAQVRMLPPAEGDAKGRPRREGPARHVWPARIWEVMTGLAADPVCKEHLTGPQHPEQPARFDAAVGALRDLKLVPIPPRLANHDELALCHSRQYIQLAEREIFEGFHELSTGDTIISPKSLDAALRATGGALNAVDAIVEKRISNAICIGRPPGHHANAMRGMGFCIFNTIAIAARYAQKKHGIGRVLIADWDVHHGNGTQDIFYTDGTRVLLQHASIAVVSGNRPQQRARRRRGRRHDAELPLSGGLRAQGDSGRVPGALDRRGGRS